MKHTFTVLHKVFFLSLYWPWNTLRNSCLIPLREKSSPRKDFIILWASPISIPSIPYYFPIRFPSFHFISPIISIFLNKSLSFHFKGKGKRRRERKEISPYLLQSGYIMECCPEPWKCQGEKEKCEGRKEDGQRRKKRGKERWSEDAWFCLFEDIWLCPMTGFGL